MHQKNCQHLKKIADKLEVLLKEFVQGELAFQELLGLGFELHKGYKKNLIRPCAQCDDCGDYQFYEKELADTIFNEGTDKKGLSQKLQFWDKIKASSKIIEHLSIERTFLPKEKAPQELLDQYSTVYWDFNVFQRIEDGDPIPICETPKDALFLYSPIHLEEVYRMKDPLFINKRIETISRITENHFIYCGQEGINIYKEHPRVSYEVSLKNIELSEAAEAYRVVKKADKDLFWTDAFGETVGAKKGNSPNIFEEISVSELKQRLIFSGYSGTLEALKKKNKTFSEILNAVHSLIGVLDNLGYRRDKKTRHLKSSIYDIEHLTYASFCAYFVTTDKKLEARANQIYRYMGVPTKVISSSKL